jgi:hypothetical protein
MTRVLVGSLLLSFAAAAASTAFATDAGNALLFDGVDDQVKLALDNVFQFDEALTVEAWVRPDDLGPSGIVFGVSDSWGLYFAPSYPRAFTFAVNTSYVGGLGDAAFGGDPQRGVWCHVAGTYDGTWIRLYQNGLLVGEEGHYMPGPMLKTTQIWIGHQTGYWKGAIDEVRVWHRVLTEAEIAGSMNHALQGNEPGLVLYYRLDESAGQEVLDSSPSSFDTFLGNQPVEDRADPARIRSGALLVRDVPALSPYGVLLSIALFLVASACLLRARLRS